MNSPPAQPTFPLEQVQELVRRRAFIVTTTALAIAGAVGFDADDIVACLLALTPADFDKPISSTDRPGELLDVYRPVFRGRRLYVKLKVTSKTVLTDLLVVLSFNLK